jgi:predicted transcriptional regulator
MATVSIELDEEQARKLRERAGAARRSVQDLCREAVERYLEGDEVSGEVQRDAGYAALRAMIGLVKDGPSDLSMEHDLRPGDPLCRSSSTQGDGSRS